jgi:hypothetical protein
VANAQKVAGAITDKARDADERGMVAKSTDSGMLLKLAETNEAFIGSPAQRENVADQKSLAALIGAMQKQEQQFRDERAAWEAKIDSLSRERDRAVHEVSVRGGIIARLKSWLVLAGLLTGAVCLLCPSALWFIVRIIANRMRAHMVGVVRGFEALRQDDAESAAKAEVFLGRKMDQATKDLVIDIKDELFCRRRREAAA